MANPEDKRPLSRRPSVGELMETVTGLLTGMLVLMVVFGLLWALGAVYWLVVGAPEL
jgi:hypothetical protein